METFCNILTKFGLKKDDDTMKKGCEESRKGHDDKCIANIEDD